MGFRVKGLRVQGFTVEGRGFTVGSEGIRLMDEDILLGIEDIHLCDQSWLLMVYGMRSSVSALGLRV